MPLGEVRGSVGGVLELEPPFDEERERAELARAGGRGFLAAEAGAGGAPGGPWLALVHGVKDAPASMEPLARHLAARGYRPLHFFYDDLGRYLDRTGDELAWALSALSGALAIVAHSMGGVVARCALNSLVDPGWFPELHAPASTAAPVPVRGAGAARLEGPAVARFSRVACVTIDTPWHGFKEPRFSIRDRLPDEGSFVDMVGNSAVLTTVHDVALPSHVTIDYLEAHNEAGGKEADKVLGVGELDDEAALAVARGLVAEPGDASALRALRPTLRNYVRALRAEADAPALIAALRERAEAGRLDGAALRELAARTAPRFAGCHLSVLELPALWAEVEGTLARRLSGG